MMDNDRSALARNGRDGDWLLGITTYLAVRITLPAHTSTLILNGDMTAYKMLTILYPQSRNPSSIT